MQSKGAMDERTTTGAHRAHNGVEHLRGARENKEYSPILTQCAKDVVPTRAQPRRTAGIGANTLTHQSTA